MTPSIWFIWSFRYQKRVKPELRPVLGLFGPVKGAKVRTLGFHPKLLQTQQALHGSRRTGLQTGSSILGQGKQAK